VNLFDALIIVAEGTLSLDTASFGVYYPGAGDLSALYSLGLPLNEKVGTSSPNFLTESY
jgi:hypothetical protein